VKNANIIVLLGRKMFLQQFPHKWRWKKRQ